MSSEGPPPSTHPTNTPAMPTPKGPAPAGPTPAASQPRLMPTPAGPALPRSAPPAPPSAPAQPASNAISYTSHATIARRRTYGTVALAAITILVVGAAVVVATGALSSGAKASARPPHARSVVRKALTATAVVSSTVDEHSPSVGEQASDRGEIISLLDQYQGAYSGHNVSTLAKLFSAQIVRHGLAAGGCTVSRGRNAVLADYESQFQEGSGSYILVGLSAGQVQFENGTQAHLDGHYQITPGGSGYVNFKFTDTKEGWRISEVFATCE